jgi:hypothetical protein
LEEERENGLNDVDDDGEIVRSISGPTEEYLKAQNGIFSNHGNFYSKDETETRSNRRVDAPVLNRSFSRKAKPDVLEFPKDGVVVLKVRFLHCFFN